MAVYTNRMLQGRDKAMSDTPMHARYIPECKRCHLYHIISRGIGSSHIINVLSVYYQYGCHIMKF